MSSTSTCEEFINLHETQLRASAVPAHFWPALYKKLKAQILDAGEYFQLGLMEEDEVEADEEQTNGNTGGGDCAAINETARQPFVLFVALENGIDVEDANAIYLIDHAWTFVPSQMRQMIMANASLRARLSNLLAINEGSEHFVELVMQRIWRYCHAYWLKNPNTSAEEQTAVWYMPDEVGTAVQHSDDANFRMLPFADLTTGITYTLLFPKRSCEQYEQVTCDMVEYVPKDAPERAALLLPWQPADLRGVDFTQSEPDAEYFTTGHIPETHAKSAEMQFLQVNRNQALKVYAEYDVLREHLTASCFELVSNAADADVLWLTHHYKNFAQLTLESPNKFVNQFPYEYVLTIKDLLSISCRRTAEVCELGHHNAETLETYPKWLPTTYNLKTELLQFASYFQQRATKNLDNHWIVKPFNLARGLDTYISKNIQQIVRLPATGPKIAQKYIENPVLFERNDLQGKFKFDIRYVLLLKSVQPLEAYVHRKFFLRFANKPFSLDMLDDYEKHFTVMNYAEEYELKHIKCDEFLGLWQQQYPKHKWAAVENDICSMLHEMLVCATKREPPCGIAACPQSRALYAADIMLTWQQDNEKTEPCMQPKLLEINWTPDCKRACEYYPDFFNDIFKLLLLDETNEDCFRALSTS